jgi:hypothetical protein
MENLLEQIHVHVSKLAVNYVNEYIVSQLSQLSSDFGIPMDQLKRSLNIEASLYQVESCKAKTVLGNNCKYKAAASEIFCCKHLRQLPKKTKSPKKVKRETTTKQNI